MNTVGKKLTRLRKMHGFSQEELAGKLNISRQAIYKWESGTTLPNTENLNSLCAFFNVDINYFLTDIEEEKAYAVVHSVEEAEKNSQIMANALLTQYFHIIGKRRLRAAVVITALIVAALSVLATVFGFIAFSPLRNVDEVVRTVDIDEYGFLSCLLVWLFFVALLVFFAVKLKKNAIKPSV